MNAKKRKNAEAKMEEVGLSEEGIFAWVGEELGKLGRANMHNVSDVRRLPSGDFLGTVLGSGKQVVVVGCTKAGEITSECTCSAGCDCVHAVALALKVEELQRLGIEIAEIAEEDARLRRLDGEEGYTAESIYTNQEASRALQYIEALDADGRYQLLVDLMTKNEWNLREIAQRATFLTCSNTALISLTKREIRNLWETYGSPQTSFYKEGTPMDFSGVECALQEFLKRKLYTTFPDLGESLVKMIKRLLHKMPSVDHLLHDAARPCLTLVIEGLRQSGMRSHEMLGLEYEWRHSVKSTIFEGVPSTWDHPESYTLTDWEELANLWETIREDPPRRGVTIEDEDYIKVLLYAGRQTEAIQVMIGTLPKSGKYIEVATYLLENGFLSMVEKVCMAGFVSYRRSHKLYAGLLSVLSNFKKSCNDEAAALSYATEAFLRVPTYDRYKTIKSLAQKLGMWEHLKSAYFLYMETGKKSPKFSRTLPAVRFPKEKLGYNANSGARLGTRLLIALREQSQADVTAVLQQINVTYDFHFSLSLEAIFELATIYPEKSLPFWSVCLTNILIIDHLEYAPKKLHETIIAMHAAFKACDKLPLYEKTIKVFLREHVYSTKICQDVQLIMDSIRKAELGK